MFSFRSTLYFFSLLIGLAVTLPLASAGVVNATATCPAGFWGSTCEELCMCRRALSDSARASRVQVNPASDPIYQFADRSADAGVGASQTDETFLAAQLTGSCDVATGECTCFSDAARGYWAGAQCSQCQDGYVFASSCRMLAVALGLSPTIVLTDAAPSLSAVSAGVSRATGTYGLGATHVQTNASDGVDAITVSEAEQRLSAGDAWVAAAALHATRASQPFLQWATVGTRTQRKGLELPTPNSPLIEAASRVGAPNSQAYANARADTSLPDTAIYGYASGSGVASFNWSRITGASVEHDEQSDVLAAAAELHPCAVRTFQPWTSGSSTGRTYVPVLMAALTRVAGRTFGDDLNRLREALNATRGREGMVSLSPAIGALGGIAHEERFNVSAGEWVDEDNVRYLGPASALCVPGRVVLYSYVPPAARAAFATRGGGVTSGQAAAAAAAAARATWRNTIRFEGSLVPFDMSRDFISRIRGRQVAVEPNTQPLVQLLHGPGSTEHIENANASSLASVVLPEVVLTKSNSTSESVTAVDATQVVRSARWGISVPQWGSWCVLTASAMAPSNTSPYATLGRRVNTYNSLLRALLARNGSQSPSPLASADFAGPEAFDDAEDSGTGCDAAAITEAAAALSSIEAEQPSVCTTAECWADTGPALHPNVQSAHCTRTHPVVTRRSAVRHTVQCTAYRWVAAGAYDEAPFLPPRTLNTPVWSSADNATVQFLPALNVNFSLPPMADTSMLREAAGGVRTSRYRNDSCIGSRTARRGCAVLRHSAGLTDWSGAGAIVAYGSRWNATHVLRLKAEETDAQVFADAAASITGVTPSDVAASGSGEYPAQLEACYAVAMYRNGTTVDVFEYLAVLVDAFDSLRRAAVMNEQSRATTVTHALLPGQEELATAEALEPLLNGGCIAVDAVQSAADAQYGAATSGVLDTTSAVVLSLRTRAGVRMIFLAPPIASPFAGNNSDTRLTAYVRVVKTLLPASYTTVAASIAPAAGVTTGSGGDTALTPALNGWVQRLAALGPIAVAVCPSEDVTAWGGAQFPFFDGTGGTATVADCYVLRPGPSAELIGQLHDNGSWAIGAIPNAAVQTQTNLSDITSVLEVVAQRVVGIAPPLSAVAFAGNSLITVSSPLPGIEARRFLSFVITGVVPRAADATGGTPLYVFGSGFRATAALACAFRTSGCASTSACTEALGARTVVPATFISTHVLRCSAPPASVETLSSCNTADLIEVTLDGSTFSGSGAVSVQRLVQPVLVAVAPPSVPVNAPDGLMVTITGSGFTYTGSTMCVFSSDTVTMSTRGYFISESSMVCVAPSYAAPLGSGTTVNVALDGHTPSNYPLAFAVVGPATGIAFNASGISLQAAAVSRLPVLTLLTVDATLNFAVTMENLAGVVTMVPRMCSAAVPCTDAEARAALAATPSTNTSLRGVTSIPVIGGQGLLNRGYLVSPQATSTMVGGYYLLAAQVAQWFATLRLEVVPGLPARLVVQTQPSATVPSSGDLVSNPIVAVQDAGGNSVLELFDGESVSAAIIQDPTPDGVELAAVAVIVNQNRTVRFASGVVEFNDLSVRARFGLAYRVYFWMPNHPEIEPATSTAIVAMCDPGNFQRPGEYECRACMAHATCDGQNVSVNPGYWRASVLALAVTQCSYDLACPGGTVPAQCAPHYMGPACSQCESGYGRGVSGGCDACPSSAVSAVVVVGMVVVVTLMLSGFVVFTVQNSDRYNPLMTVVTLLVSHLQTLVLVAASDQPWPAYYVTLSRWLDALVDFRILGTAFGECLLSDFGLNYLAQFVFQLALVLDVALCIAVARAALFFRPSFLRRRGLKGLLRRPLPITVPRIFITSFLVGAFFLHEGVIMYAFSMVQCVEIEGLEGGAASYLRADTSIRCDASLYQTVRTYLVYPVIAFSTVIIPLLVLIAFPLHRAVFPKLRNTRYQLGAFLLGGLNADVWWWPAFVFARKSLMCVVVSLLSYPFDMLLCELLLVIHAAVAVVCRPYVDRSYVSADAGGALTIILLFNVASLYRTTSSDAVHVAVGWIVLGLEIVSVAMFPFVTSKRVRHFALRALGLMERRVDHVDAMLQPDEILRVDSVVLNDDDKRQVDAIMDEVLSDPLSLGGGVARSHSRDTFSSEPASRDDAILSEDDELAMELMLSTAARGGWGGREDGVRREPTPPPAPGNGTPRSPSMSYRAAVGRPRSAAHQRLHDAASNTVYLPTPEPPSPPRVSRTAYARDPLHRFGASAGWTSSGPQSSTHHLSRVAAPRFYEAPVANGENLGATHRDLERRLQAVEAQQRADAVQMRRDIANATSMARWHINDTEADRGGPVTPARIAAALSNRDLF